MRGKIYKIYCDITNLTYYGSTTQSLSKRLGQHKHYTQPMIDKMDIPKIYLVEELDFESREKMLQRERWWIENNECINMRLPTRTDKELREANKERKKENYQVNKEKILEQRKEHYQANKERINEKRREKIECECGLFYTRRNKAQHQKSKRHNELIKKNNN